MATMATTGRKLIAQMERLSPPVLAMEKDRIGLQVGDPEAEVKGVLLALDVTEAVVDEAIALGANWIIAHHAVIFRPLGDLRRDRPAGRLFAKLLKHDIQVYVAHTNFDSATGGVNDVLAQKLGLTETDVLIPVHRETYKKLVVTIPKDHHDAVLQAICKAGAGWIGNYSHCTFNLEGTGTFRPEEGTDPYIGEQGQLERVGEVRLETIVPTTIQTRVVSALIKAHPYEEVAYDLYPLDLEGAVQGLGRVGRLDQTLSLSHLANQVKKAYGLSHLRFVGNPDVRVQTVAVLGGAGGRYWPEAKRLGADVYITGDIDHHTAMDAREAGVCLIDPGHHVEYLALESLRQQLSEMNTEKEITIQVSTIETSPFSFV
ncbi:Nif3-like dinuclear metal center hexameric protein [Desmospora activa]|uniref:GTP cyclohydrolase 1 type 2 homolog n=1 Tax=Desmospora activa DSM 45169 TaxID=1121389 RepID=A0A2T4ZC30_9BACL|nr:Nif3-like dinuclear metal center hexameric protein [Desmospora activa]PTM59453.1 dinuclear metal center YbgI/SA1388 family protein [Desmospora activa DSM 45169]